MEFRVLGSLEVRAGGVSVNVGGIRQQTVLACLLLDANRIISANRLMDAIYGQELPATSRTQVQICISSLRRLLAEHGYPGIIVTRATGYAIHVEDGQLDAQRFEQLVDRARAARAAARPADAAHLYREALGLWRGPMFDGITSRLLEMAAGRLTELRITANEDCVELELALGRHRGLVGELTQLVEEHPLRERIRGLLMTALYRSGRQAEALEVYRRTRQTMIDELGIEPSEQLRRLELAILNSDPALGLPSALEPSGTADPAEETPAIGVPAVPRMLPTDMADFTGREKELGEIEQQLVNFAAGPAPLAVSITAVVGMPGIGKTSTVIHAAHRIAGHYSDGQLYADLHGGSSSRQVSPMEVLERFLRVLGVPGRAIPPGVEERAEMYRTLLAGRRMLVVLDDAVNEAHVLPLLPGDSASAVLITSRGRLAGLPGVKHVPLEFFDADQSVSVLSHIAGAERVRSEAGTAVELARLCGYLPLALRVAGTRLAARPHWSVRQLTRRLEDETRRLDELTYGNLGIRATISLSYEGVSQPARRLFRRLAILDAPLFPGWVGAPLLDMRLADAADLLDELIDAQLIRAAGVGHGIGGHYRFHDLIRVFARERLVADEPAAERERALERALGAILFLTERAHHKEYGGAYVQVHSSAPRWPLHDDLTERLLADPLAWYDSERTCLVSGIHQAAQAGLTDYCWDLAICAVTLFESRMYLDDWRSTHQIALEATRRAGDTRGQAAIRYSIGSLHIYEQRFDQARGHLDEAVTLFRKLNDEYGTALAARNIAFLDRTAGRLDAAMGNYDFALGAFRRAGDQVAEAYVLHNLAQLSLERGDCARAGELVSDALRLSRAAGSKRVEAQVLHRMGEVHLHAESPAKAVEVLAEGMSCARDIGDPVGEAYTLGALGIARLRLGDLVEADRVLRRAQQLATSVGDKLAEARILLGKGELALARGRLDETVACAREALALFRAIGVPLSEALALVMLSDAYAAAGDEQAARSAAADALTTGELGDGTAMPRLHARLADPPEHA